MTTVFEVHFTDADEFIVELKADQAKGSIVDNLVRIAIRNGSATLDMISGKRDPGGDRLNPNWRSRFVEASYISTRQQLVKLSAYCGSGVRPNTTSAGEMRPGAYFAPNALEWITIKTDATEKAVSSTVRKLQAALARMDNIEVRGGGIYVEEGAWVADPDYPLEGAPDVMCITCIELIYFANEQWRHRESGRAEAYDDEPCPDCGGMAFDTIGRTCRRCLTSPEKGRIQILDHLADPEVEGRKV